MSLSFKAESKTLILWVSMLRLSPRLELSEIETKTTSQFLEYFQSNQVFLSIVKWLLWNKKNMDTAMLSCSDQQDKDQTYRTKTGNFNLIIKVLISRLCLWKLKHLILSFKTRSLTASLWGSITRPSPKLESSESQGPSLRPTQRPRIWLRPGMRPRVSLNSFLGPYEFKF